MSSGPGRPGGQKQTYRRDGAPRSATPPPPKRAPARQKPKKRNRSGIVLLVSVLVVAGIATTLIAVNTIMSKGGGPALDGSANTGGVPASAVSVVPPQPTERRVSFSAVGDNLIHDGIYLQAADRAGGNGYDFSYIYANLSYFFQDYDVNWINQETLVNSANAPSSYPQFSTPVELGQAAYDVGWRVFALSNNHTYDKHASGVIGTMEFWDSMPDDVVTPGLFTGNDEQDIKLHEVNGMTIAYLSYTEYTNGIPTPADTPAWVIYTDDRETMQRQVSLARGMADVVVVGVHWGVENSHEVTGAQRDLAAEYAAWGADVVIGTHPHVIQPVEWLVNEADGRRVLVAYSLGNFISAQAQADNLIGIALTFELAQTVDPDGTAQAVRVENVHAWPTVTHYDGGYANIRDYMFRDYTDELAAAHGVQARYPGFNRAYVQQVAETYIDPEFLVLD